MSPRVPPQNLEAEQAVLGGIMVDAGALDKVVDIISEADFYSSAHRKIYQAILGLKYKNQPVDLITVSTFLRDSGDLEAVGGTGYLASVIEQTPTSANIEAHAQIVRDKAVLRKVIEICTNTIETAYGQEFEDLDKFINEVEAAVFRVAQTSKTTGLVHARDIVKTSIEKIEEMFNQGASITGTPTGFVDLDKMTSGFQPGEMIIIAARPSMGKSAFAFNIAQHMALHGKKSVAFFSLEMGQEQVMMRMLGSEAKISLSDLKVGRVTDNAWPQLIKVANKFSEANMYIDDTSALSPFEVRARCRRLKAQKGLDVVFIDYLQIMDLKAKVESRERAISEISKQLKSMAKELKIPVVVLSQINRGVEGRTDRRPMMSDLRESGAIEQDADVIMMIYRDEYYERDNSENKGQAEIIIGKQRNGATGIVKLAWLPQYGAFANLQLTDRPTTQVFSQL